MYSNGTNEELDESIVTDRSTPFTYVNYVTFLLFY